MTPVAQDIMDAQSKITEFVLSLQKQKTVPLWSLQREMIVYFAALDEKAVLGPKTTRLVKLMGAAYKYRVSDVLIFCVGMFQIIRNWLKLIKLNTGKYKKDNTAFSAAFAACGGSPDDYLYLKLSKRFQQDLLRINLVSMDGMKNLFCPKLFPMLRVLFQHAFGYTSKLKSVGNMILNQRTHEFLTVCAINIGQYALFSSFWQGAQKHGIEEVVFLTLDVAIFACLDVGIKVTYLQHGLWSRMLLIPKADHFELLTLEEEFYLRSIYPDANITQTQTMINIPNKRNILMILSPNRFIEKRLPDLTSITQWALQLNLKVVIRPTKPVTKMEMTALKETIPLALFDDIDRPIEESFLDWRPKIVVSWFTTALITAYHYGLLPVSLASPDMNTIWRDESRSHPNDWLISVYPMRDRIMFWPRDKQRIVKYI